MSGTEYTLTANYLLKKPDNQDDDDQWGLHWNQNADAIDGLLFAQNPAGAYVPIGGGTMTGQLDITHDTAAALHITGTGPGWPAVSFNSTKTGTAAAFLESRRNGVVRWGMQLGDTVLESGANAGSNFRLGRYKDDGSFLADAIVIARNTGLMTVAGGGAFTTLSASSTVSGAGFTAWAASPPAIGGTTPSTGKFTTMQSTVATGTAPLTVASTTNVANLNASSLSGATFAAPGAIGSTTPGSGAFTTLAASSTISGAGFTAWLASPPAIGGTAPAAGAFTTLSATSTIAGAGFTAWLASPPAIGATTPSTGKFTTIQSTIATGTAPLTVASTTVVANLNASSLNGATFAAPGAIGGTTPAAVTSTQINMTTSAGANIRAGTGAATGTQPKGSIWLRTDGGVATTLYVSQGAGTWNAVAGV